MWRRATRRRRLRLVGALTLPTALSLFISSAPIKRVHHLVVGTVLTKMKRGRGMRPPSIIRPSQRHCRLRAGSAACFRQTPLQPEPPRLSLGPRRGREGRRPQWRPHLCAIRTWRPMAYARLICSPLSSPPNASRKMSRRMLLLLLRCFPKRRMLRRHLQQTPQLLRQRLRTTLATKGLPLEPAPADPRLQLPPRVPPPPPSTTTATRCGPPPNSARTH